MVDEINKDELGKRIKEIRSSLGQTAEVFGDNFDPPANRSLVSSWENGRYVPGPSRVKKIAELADVSVNELLYGDVEKYIEGVLRNDISSEGHLYRLIEDHLKDTTDLYEIKADRVITPKGNRHTFVDGTKEEFEKINTAVIEFFNNNLSDMILYIKNSEPSFDEEQIIRRASMYILKESALALKSFRGQYFGYKKLNDNISSYLADQPKPDAVINIKSLNALDLLYQNKLSNAASDFISDIDTLYKEYSDKLNKFD